MKKSNIFKTSFIFLAMFTLFFIAMNHVKGAEKEAVDPNYIDYTTLASKTMYQTRRYTNKELPSSPKAIVYNDGYYSGMLYYRYMEFNRDGYWYVTYSGVLSTGPFIPTNTNLIK